MKLRSPRELAVRVKQQVTQFVDLLRPPPHFRRQLQRLPLPDPPIAIAQGAQLPQVRDLAEAILRHRFSLFETEIDFGEKIDWRRDYRHGKSTPIAWHRRIQYLDFEQCGDHKWVWELNRHQHLVVLAQAWTITRDERYVREIESQLKSWDAQNPFVRSINWASALEIAFRALSWMWVLHLCGESLTQSTRELLGTMLVQHGTAIAHNLSTYFAPNTHILGEAVALHAIGVVVGKKSWRMSGARIVERERRHQIQRDGFHFEQSTYYHLYALDMFVFHYLIAGRPARFEDDVRRMARIAASLVDMQGVMPLIGDDDGGRFFHPFGPRPEFARASLSTCAALFPEERLPARERDGAEQAMWWLGSRAVPENGIPDRCEHFRSSELTVFRRGLTHIVFDCGPFGAGGAGHSHADTLALTVRHDGHEILTDPGTFTYVADPAERDWFRGTAAHSTMRLGGRDQADAVRPFRWENKPKVRRCFEAEWRAAGECSYRGWTHARTVDFRHTEKLEITDTISGPDEMIEQIWHSAVPITPVSEHRFALGPVLIDIDIRLEPVVRPAFRSVVYGSKVPSYILHCSMGAPPGSALTTTLHFLEPK